MSEAKVAVQDVVLDVLGNKPVVGLKQKSIRGGVIAISAQAFKLVLQTISITVLSRLLIPGDFGIQSMVVAMTGFLGIFRDGGLSMATVQQEVITHEQTSTLFWINVMVGTFLALMAAAVAPLLVMFYREPRLLDATIISGLAFIFNGLAAQHQALLVRKLRFIAMATVEVLAIGGGTLVGIIMGIMGFGYWSLIGAAVSGPAIAMISVWIAVPWRPGKPDFGSGIRSMLHFGGTVTGDTVVIYFGYNGEKFLLGRFFGSTVLGLYTRAYQLINLPLQQLSSSMFNIIFPALSRIQNDSERVCRFFLKSYSLMLSLCMPVALAAALFAGDVIPVVLGPKWTASIPILRLLSPTIIAFSLINPFGWFLLATGRAMRSLQTAFMVTPAVLLGIALGLPHGPSGVAMGYSVSMVLLIIPVIAWSKKGTGMQTADVLEAVKGPILSGICAAAAGLIFKFFCENSMGQFLRLSFGIITVFGTYFGVLLFGMGQRQFYLELIRQLGSKADLPPDTSNQDQIECPTRIWK